MGALEDFLETIPDTFDFDQLLDADVQKIESDTYNNSFVYKYYPSARRSFFEKPQIRFSQREALNDKFEMTRRWQEIRADGIKGYVDQRLRSTIPQAALNCELMIAMLEEEFRQNGIPLGHNQIDIIKNFLQSNEGQALVREKLKATEAAIQPMIEVVFAQLEAKFDDIIEKFAQSVGVLSLSEDRLSEQMWAHYAEQGKGFVVGLDAQNAFFNYVTTSIKKSLLKKTIYTNERTENFWRNPYYLFLVKSTGWSYEKEWRMLKKLSDCDESNTSVTPYIYLCNVPPDAIKTIHFGYEYGQDEMKSDMARLRKMGASPTFYRMAVNRQVGTLEEHLVS
ncbi:DUF2971 domain-containing protein [Rubrivivax sp. JA1024]|nr:DUF2971 domain-containing protein [Rubrivivax sp. JA1024]